MLLESQNVVGRKDGGRPATFWMRHVGLSSIQVSGKDSSLRTVKRVCAQSPLAIAVVAPADPSGIIDRRQEPRTWSASDQDRRAGRLRLFRAARSAGRKCPEPHALNFKPRAFESRGQAMIGAIIGDEHYQRARLQDTE